VYRAAVPGIALLDPVARPCISTAAVLYGGILDAVARDGYTVLHRRSVVPRRRRALVAAHGLTRVAAARLRARVRPAPPTGPAGTSLYRPLPAAAPSRAAAVRLAEEVS
jgi:phytoene synthase